MHAPTPLPLPTPASSLGLPGSPTNATGLSVRLPVSTGPELGIRQSRHMVSSVPLQDQILVDGVVTDDAGALGAWPSEYLPGSGLAPEWLTIGGDLYFGVTLDNLRSADTANLFALAGRSPGIAE